MTDELDRPSERPWQRLSRRALHQNPWRQLFLDRVRIHGGVEIDYTLAECPPAAFVVPLTVDHQIVLIRQYRYPIEDWVWEIPAGSIEHESPDQSARRELLEEIGGRADEMISLGRFYTAAAHLRLECLPFLATGVTLGGVRHEATELLTIEAFPARIALEMARRGEVNEAQSALAILMAEPAILARLEA